MHPLFGILGGAGLTLAACLGLGRAAWRRAPHWTLQLASGSALLATLLFLLLVLRWAHPAVIAPLCLAVSAPLWRGLKLPKPGVRAWLLAPAAAYGLYYLIHALAPEIQPDAAGYHLGLVADWARQRGMSPRIGFYELLPLGLEVIFYPAFLLGGHSAAKLAHFGYFLATIPLMGWIGQKIGLNSSAAFCASGLYFLTPVAGIAGTCAYNDAAAAFFPLAAFGALLCAGETRQAFFHAGLAAGFAYAVKMPGAAAAAGSLLWSLARGGRRAALLCLAGAALCAGPWLARNAILTGNPLAPLGNRIFSNDHFHPQSERHLAQKLATYDGVTPFRVLHALAWDGTDLQGLIGPALFLLPLSLVAARRARGRLLLAAALLLLLPWTRNIGARFLLPSLPFFFLAFASVAGSRGMATLLLLQAVAVSPWALERYAGEHAWRLRGLPWRAALRLEPEAEFLRRTLFEYPFAEKAAPLVNEERLLDLYGLPSSYMRTVPLGPLSSAEFDNAVIFLGAAAAPRPERTVVLQATLPGRLYRAVRIRLEKDWPGMWSVHDLMLEWRARRIRPSSRWLLDADPNPGDAFLALDQNPGTRWFTWDNGRAGAWLQITFDRPRPLDTVLLRTIDAPPLPPVSLWAQDTRSQWRDFTPQWRRVTTERRFWRRQVTEYLHRRGIRWIAAPLWGEGYGRVGRSMRDQPSAWGVRLAVAERGLALFRIEPPDNSH